MRARGPTRGATVLNRLVLVLLGAAALAFAAYLVASALSGSEATSERTLSVPGRANIFGAGRKVPPDPGYGGGGTSPPVLRLPTGSTVVAFPSITGAVSAAIPFGSVRAGPDDMFGPAGEEALTDIESFRGISGIVHNRGLFLVGVFLTDAPPSGPAPPRLDFTDRKFDELAPRVGQTFLIGDGKGHRYGVPSGATRLFLGFADAFLYKGDPGWYDNNDGRLSVTVGLRS